MTLCRHNTLKLGWLTNLAAKVSWFSEGKAFLAINQEYFRKFNEDSAR
jgi:hypothetical protein